MLAKKPGSALAELLLHFPHAVAGEVSHHDYGSYRVALADDGGHYSGEILVRPVNHGHGVAAAGLHDEKPLFVHKLLKTVANALFLEFLPWRAGHGYDVVLIGDEHRRTAGFGQCFGVLRGEVAQLADGGILFKNYLSVPLGEYLQRVTLADAQGAANFLGNDDPAEVV